MNKAQKRLVSSLAAAASVAAVLAPAATVFAATKDDAKALLENAKKTMAFVDYNQAYAAIVALPAADQPALLAELTPLWDKVATKDVTDVLKTMEALAKDKDLKNYYDLYDMIEKTVTLPRNQQYLMGELTSWGKTSVFTADVTTATDALIKAWTDKTPESITAAKEAIAKVTNAGSLAYLNADVANLESQMALTISEAKATGAKELTVKFNKAVDATKAVVTVKKGNLTVGSTATFGTDNTSAKIALTSKITEGEYTVTVSGVDTKDLTAKVTATDEKIAKIDILSETAVAKVNPATNVIESVYAYYKVTNQYGEDITKTASVIVSAGLGAPSDLSVDSANGKVEIQNLNSTGIVNTRVGDKFALSVINADSSNSTASASAVLTISSSANVASIEVSKLYNTDGKTLNEVSTASDYMLLLNLKDQYGNVINDKTQVANDLVVSSSNTWIVDVDTNVTTGAANVDNIYIGTQKNLVVRLKAGNQGLHAGKVVINIISKSSGKSAQFEVEVTAGGKVSKVTLNQPDLAAVNDAVNIPFTAYDAQGNVITDLDVINDTNKGAQITGWSNSSSNPVFVKDAAGNTYIQIVPNLKGYANVSVQARNITASTGVATINVNVKEEAVPTSIVKVNVGVNALAGEQVQVDYDDIVYADQYGRTMTSSDVKYKMNATVSGLPGVAGTNYRVAVTTTGALAVNGTNTYITPSANVKYTAGVANGLTYDAGVGTLTLQLQKLDSGTWKNVSGGDYSVQARGVKIDDVKTFTVADLPKVLDVTKMVADGKSTTVTYPANTDYHAQFQVKGTLSDGSTILIPAVAQARDAAGNQKVYYNVADGSSEIDTQTYLAAKTAIGATLSGEDLSKFDINVNAAGIDYGNDVDVTTKAYKIQVTLNHNGATITKDLTAAEDAPTLTKVNFVDDVTYVDGTIVNNVDTGSIYKALVAGGTVNADTFLDATVANGGTLVQLYDQYGKDFKLNSVMNDTETADKVNVNTTTGEVFRSGVVWKTKLMGLTFSDLSNDSMNISGNGTLGANITSVSSGDSFNVTFTFDNGMAATLKVVVR